MNKLKTFIAVVLTVVTLSHSTFSEAAVGKLTHRQKLVTAGLAISGTGVAITIGGMAIVKATCVDLGCLAVLFPIMAGGIVAVAGLITLDGEQEMQFMALNQTDAARIGVSESERVSFNEEIDQANMMMTDVAVEMTKLSNPTAQDSLNAWNQVKDLVSPQTFAAMQKIVSQK